MSHREKNPYEAVKTPVYTGRVVMPSMYYRDDDDGDSTSNAGQPGEERQTFQKHQPVKKHQPVEKYQTDNNKDDDDDWDDDDENQIYDYGSNEDEPNEQEQFAKDNWSEDESNQQQQTDDATDVWSWINNVQVRASFWFSKKWLIQNNEERETLILLIQNISDDSWINIREVFEENRNNARKHDSDLNLKHIEF